MVEGWMMVFLIVAALLVVVMAGLLVGSLVVVMRLVPKRDRRRGPVLVWPAVKADEGG
jgi:hypothetical protein